MARCASGPEGSGTVVLDGDDRFDDPPSFTWSDSLTKVPRTSGRKTGSIVLGERSGEGCGEGRRPPAAWVETFESARARKLPDVGVTGGARTVARNPSAALEGGLDLAAKPALLGPGPGSPEAFPTLLTPLDSARDALPAALEMVDRIFIVVVGVCSSDDRSEAEATPGELAEAVP
jgi:hypothetical protein